MTDLEITKLCAEAMGIELFSAFGVKEYMRWPSHFDRDTSDDIGALKRYAPLHDDAQAMALVKRFHIHLTHWAQNKDWTAAFDRYSAKDKNLNRAICECVAKMQEAKAA